MKFNHGTFFDSYKNTFGDINQKQMEGLDGLLSFVEADPLIKIPEWFAYMLATVKHECADTYIPIYEKGQISYFDKYEPGTAIGMRLGNILQGDGYMFRGRGYVQITGRANYKRMTEILRLAGNDDLISNPDRALIPAVAYRIMSYGMVNGSFTGKKLDDYINSTGADYLQARRIINALDQAERIRDYALKFNSIIKGSIISENSIDPANLVENLSDEEKDKLFINNVTEINKMNVSAGSLVKNLIMELNRDNRNTYIKLRDAVPNGHAVHYELVEGDIHLVLNIAFALGFKNATGDFLEVRDV